MIGENDEQRVDRGHGCCVCTFPISPGGHAWPHDAML